MGKYTGIDFPAELIQEGGVDVLVPELGAFVNTPSEYAPSKAPVFYNPVMELNRDIAVLVLQVYQKSVDREISVCEPLAGCGIRGLRFAKEVEGVRKVLVNDINVKACKLADYNVNMNRLSNSITVENMDANFLLCSHGAPQRRFDAIDIDPFGSPSSYIDSGIRALRNEGLLALTATDMAPLCGIHPKACIRKYGGTPLHTEYCHELAVRLLVGSLAKSAAKYDMGMEIILSHSTDHYIRVYAIGKYGASKADGTMREMGYILHCFRCLHREHARGFFPTELPLKCGECGERLYSAGPLWLGKLSNAQFCSLLEKEVEQRQLNHKGKIQRILRLIGNEASAPITYFVLDRISSKLDLPVPSNKQVVDTLKNRGFSAFLTHFNSKGVRTDASSKDVHKAISDIQDVTSFK